MEELYRKFLEPEYGEAAPDAIVEEPQNMDLEHPTEARICMNFETIHLFRKRIMIFQCGSICRREKDLIKFWCFIMAAAGA